MLKKLREVSRENMSDYVRIIVSIAAQWRVVRALGPSALALAGVPVTGPAARPRRRRPAAAKRAESKNGNGAQPPQNGHKAWK